jgi:hypothetical protein
MGYLAYPAITKMGNYQDETGIKSPLKPLPSKENGSNRMNGYHLNGLGGIRTPDTVVRSHVL